MSYGINIVNSPPDSVRDNLRAAKEKYAASLAASDYALDSAASDSIDAGIDAAVALVNTGKFGSEKVTVGVTGHANPGHQPTYGFANDTISVQITDMRPTPQTP